MSGEIPAPWGDDLSKLWADYPDLDIWTISGHWWLMADRESGTGLMPLIRRRTPGLLRDALDARARGEPVPLDP
jgi:hypothetical protein